MAKGILNDGVNAGPHQRRRYDPEGSEDAQDERVALSGSAAGDHTDGTVEGSQIGVEPDAVDIPDGIHNVDDLLDWVGEEDTGLSRARAQVVLDRENESEDPRTTLVGPLEDLLTAPPSDPA